MYSSIIRKQVKDLPIPFSLDDSMAKDPKAALELMRSVWTPAREQFKKDVVEIEKLAGFKIEPWDYWFYAEKVRKAKYDLDENEVKPYLQLDKLREAGRL